MSPVPVARSSATVPDVGDAKSTRRSFQRRSCPYESTLVIRSYRSAIVAKSVRTYRRFPSGVAMRSLTDIRSIISLADAALEHCRTLSEGHLPGPVGVPTRQSTHFDGLRRLGARCHPRNRDDDGEGFG